MTLRIVWSALGLALSSASITLPARVDDAASQTRTRPMRNGKWTKDRDDLPPRTVGTLADLDPAVLVTPPKGLEIGYVSIVTR